MKIFRYLFIPLLIISVIITSICIVIYLLHNDDAIFVNKNIGPYMYPFVVIPLFLEAVLLHLTDFGISLSTLFCSLLLIINMVIYIMLIFYSIKGKEETKKHVAGVIIFLTCIDTIFICASSLTQVFVLVLALALRALIIASCAVNIKIINKF